MELNCSLEELRQTTTRVRLGIRELESLQRYACRFDPPSEERAAMVSLDYRGSGGARLRNSELRQVAGHDFDEQLCFQPDVA